MDCRRGLQTVDLVNISRSKDAERITNTTPRETTQSLQRIASRQNPARRADVKDCVWLKPELVAQIVFTEWTPDGHLRHSRFVGLRDDKDVREVVREG